MALQFAIFNTYVCFGLREHVVFESPCLASRVPVRDNARFQHDNFDSCTCYVVFFGDV